MHLGIALIIISPSFIIILWHIVLRFSNWEIVYVWIRHWFGQKVGRQFGVTAARQPSPLSLNLNSIPALVAGTGGHLKGRKNTELFCCCRSLQWLLKSWGGEGREVQDDVWHGECCSMQPTSQGNWLLWGGWCSIYQSLLQRQPPLCTNPTNF